MLYLFVVVYGFFYGGKVPLVPALIGFYFGTKSLGQLIGFVHAISLVGGAVGPLLAGYVVDVTGNYMIAFLLGAVFLAFATFFAWLSKPPRYKGPMHSHIGADRYKAIDSRKEGLFRQ